MEKVKVVITDRYFDRRDLQYVRNVSLSVVCFPKPQHISKDQVKSLHKECKNADLLIVNMLGSPTESLLKLNLDAIGIPKAFWSYDSHHSADMELKYADKFDRLFIAHSPYLYKFNGFHVEWLPCAFHRYGIDDLIRIGNGKLPKFDSAPTRFLNWLTKHPKDKKTIDVAFPHRFYSVGNREKLVTDLCKKMREAGLRVFFNPVQIGWPYMEVLRRSRVILNLSLLDDLNLRNFEAWGINGVLLTNKVPDHNRIIGINMSHTYFFSRDLSDFDVLLNRALCDEDDIRTSEEILNSHMKIHRYINIINSCLEKKYSVAISGDYDGRQKS